MPITVKCQCGKTLKVDDKHRGKKAKCPACGNVLLVEESDADTGVQAEAPKKSRASDDDTGAVKSGAPRKRADADDDDDGDSGVRKKPKRPAKSNMMMYLLGGGCALLLLGTCCIGGGGTGLFWYLGWWPFGGVDADMIYVHEGVLGFGTARVAEGWKHPSTQNMFKNMPGGKKDMDEKLKEMEGKLGNKIEDLERVTFIMRSLDVNKMRDPPDMLFVFKTSKPMDKKKILDTVVKESRAKDKEQEVKFDGGTIYTIAGPGGRETMAFYWPSDKILVFNPTKGAESIKDAVKQSKKPAKHPAIVRGVQAAKSGRHVLVVAFEVKKSWTDMIPPDVSGKAPNLLKTNGIIVTSSMTAKESSFEAIFTFENKDIAGKAKTEAVDGIGTIKTLFKGKNAAIDKSLDSLKVDQRGAEVIVSGKSDNDVDFGPGIFGPGFGAGPGMRDEVAMAGGGGAQAPIGPGPLAAAPKITFADNMKQVGLAMHSFHDVNKALPNHAIRHPQSGAPLLSWRVAILPYLEESPLFAQIRIDEPWNSPHNGQFHNKMPRIYQVPGRPNDGKTHLQDSDSASVGA